MVKSHFSNNLMIDWLLFGSIRFQDLLELTLLTLRLLQLLFHVFQARGREAVPDAN
jgi:hypothetical protein